tara:strand:+ start:894 stop:1205 length:312 start_codon:yes stop_codon:yes gene_type:complete
MKRSIKIRALLIDKMVTVKCIISHPMENGKSRAGNTGKRIRPHYIREVIATRNNRVVMEAFWGASISKNPYLSFEIPGKKGDLISISWLDNKGASDSASIRVA